MLLRDNPHLVRPIQTSCSDRILNQEQKKQYLITFQFEGPGGSAGAKALLLRRTLSIIELPLKNARVDLLYLLKRRSRFQLY
ncbi:hypothetical protein GJ744_009789 [Endocarpon pusillum]|uniref:Uncharacterized protein n=1 Tax=Endocarpon pusillum TaxID=364733 RepID=A0A8H7AQB1_9EURO|nr:hypothetical protein GJ744_009789 [Endocarpon pusillum]